MRSFLAGIWANNKAAQQAILGRYRLPRDLSVKLVELRGIELDGQELGRLDEEVLSLPPSRRRS